jgi:hypothetical protein
MYFAVQIDSDNVVTEEHAKSGAAGSSSRGEKWLEYPFRRVACHAGAGVGVVDAQ